MTYEAPYFAENQQLSPVLFDFTQKRCLTTAPYASFLYPFLSYKTLPDRL